MQQWSHVTIHEFISMHVVSGPSSMDSTSLLSPVPCPVLTWRNNLGPETAIASAPVGAVRRMDSTAMVKIYSVVQMVKHMSSCTWLCPVWFALISFLRTYLWCCKFWGAKSRFGHLEQFNQPKFFKFVVCNPCQSSPSLTILVPLWFIIISLMFFYLSKLLFSRFLQFKGNFVRGQNNSKCR